MAKEETTEQIKEVLRQIIKYRFWISIGFAALFAVIAYFMGSGPVQAEANKQITTIKNAVKDVEVYKSPSKPTDHYKPIVEEKTGIMSKDVNKAWKELYDRQAPLLTWPETVKGRFSKWGRTWPETEDAGKVRVAIVDYVYAYPAYVDMVYRTFNPFDYETGKGIVAAPAKEELLRPAPFTVESMPGMGKVWAAQERLWIQRTLLEVVREVNKNAKDWDSAYIKEIVGLEVGNPLAQDQVSLAKGQQLTPAPEILAPGETSASADGGGGAAPGGMGMPAMPGGKGGMMGQMGGMNAMGAMGPGMRGGGGGSGAGTQYDDTIYYVTPAVDKNQYKILPVSMTVLINQEHVQDLLVELENSPMSVQVMDFELQRPATRVTKPEKGEMPAGMGMGMGMGMGRMGMMGGMMGQQAFGGMASQMAMRNQMSMGNMAGMRQGMMAGMGGAGGRMGMGASGKEERKKVDISNVDRKKEREKQAEEIAKRKGPSLFDAYFNIVEVKVYGQARFFNPPPAEAQEQPSLGAAGETPAAPAPTGGAAPAAATAPAAGTGTTPGPAEKTATPAPAEKAGAAAPDAKSAQPQPASGTAPAKPEAAQPADAAKPEAAQPADAKPAAPPAEPAKPDAKAAAVKK